MEPLVTAEEFAGYLQRDLDRYTAELAVGGASGLVREYCRWDLARETGAEFILDGRGSRVLNLPTLKLLAVNSVAVDGDPVDAADYAWSAGGQLYRAAGWPEGFGAITVNVDHGYDPIPDALRVVVCSIAARIYTNPETLRSRSVGGTARSFVVDVAGVTLTELEVALIAGYRLP